MQGGRSVSNRRIGPAMAAAVWHVAQKPGCCKKYVAERISPHPQPSRNWALGYEPVNRAIRAGLLKAERQANGVYVLTLPEAR